MVIPKQTKEYHTDDRQEHLEKRHRILAPLTRSHDALVRHVYLNRLDRPSQVPLQGLNLQQCGSRPTVVIRSKISMLHIKTQLNSLHSLHAKKVSHFEHLYLGEKFQPTQIHGGSSLINMGERLPV